jgi:hypothetical protein
MKFLKYITAISVFIFMLYTVYRWLKFDDKQFGLVLWILVVLILAFEYFFVKKKNREANQNFKT